MFGFWQISVYAEKRVEFLIDVPVKDRAHDVIFLPRTDDEHNTLPLTTSTSDPPPMTSNTATYVIFQDGSFSLIDVRG